MASQSDNVPTSTNTKSTQKPSTRSLRTTAQEARQQKEHQRKTRSDERDAWIRDLIRQYVQVLLEYNFLYRETGGVQFCVNPTTKDVVLQVAIAAESELTNIANLMIQLNELVDTWAQLFQNNTVVDFSQTDVHAFIQV